MGLAEGKRDLLVYAIPDAVSNCSKACEMIAKQKGEMSTEAAEAYLYYGKALLELSLKKMESSDTAKELAELTSLCAEIEERKNDHKEMQKGTYKEEKDFVSIYKGIEVNEITTKKAVAST